MRSPCTNSTSGRKSITGNGFGDIDFMYDVERFTVQRCISSMLAIFQCACATSTVLLLPVQDLTSYLNSARPFSSKDVVISGARHTTLSDFCHLHLQYINSTSGGRFVTENGFSDPNFLYDANISSVNRRLRAF